MAMMREAIQHRTGAGHHTAADETGRGEGNVLRDLHRLESAHHRAFGEHRRGGEVPTRLTVEGERLRHVAEGLTTTGRLALRAGFAHAAGRECRDDDVIALDDVGDTGTDLLDDAGPFMAEHGRRRPPEGTGRGRHVGMTHTGGHHLDDDFPGARFTDLESVEYFGCFAGENDALHGFPQV